MIIKNLLVPHNNVFAISQKLLNICKNKTTVLVFIYNNKNDNMFLLYKMLYNIKEFNAVILCCENLQEELIRIERIINENFSNTKKRTTLKIESF